MARASSTSLSWRRSSTSWECLTAVKCPAATAPPRLQPLPRRESSPNDTRLAGVCSGLAQYFDIDTTLVRILMLVAILAGTAGFWVYLVLWIVVPKALTPAQQCEMRGIAATAENMAKYARKQSK